jgi:hypothetical protein
MAEAATAQLPAWALAASTALVERYLPDACAALLPALSVTEWGLQGGPMTDAVGGGGEGGGEDGGGGGGDGEDEKAAAAAARPPPRRSSDAAGWPWSGGGGGAARTPSSPHHPHRYFTSAAEENRKGAAVALPPRAATVVVGPAAGSTCFVPGPPPPGGGGPPSGGGGRLVFARARPCGCTTTMLLPALNAARYFGALGLAGSALSARDAAATACGGTPQPLFTWNGSTSSELLRIS